MAQTTLSTNNIGKPAPRWYRITKRIIYLLAASGVTTGTLSRIGFTDNDINLIMGWLLTIGEIAGALLANGEQYAPSEIVNTDAAPGPGGGSNPNPGGLPDKP